MNNKVFTRTTLNSIGSLHEQCYKAEHLRSQSQRPDYSASISHLVCASTLQALHNIGTAAEELAEKALLEGLRTAQPEFAGTPFADKVAEIINGYVDGSDRAKLHASVELSQLSRPAREWLEQQELDQLPLKQFCVANRFGMDIIVEEKDEYRARVKAAEKHYHRIMDAMDPNVLRHFGLGKEIV